MSQFYRYRSHLLWPIQLPFKKETISLKDPAALLGWGDECGFHTHVLLLSILVVFKVLGVCIWRMVP